MTPEGRAHRAAVVCTKEGETLQMEWPEPREILRINKHE
jgi:hypothetical protein